MVIDGIFSYLINEKHDSNRAEIWAEIPEEMMKKSFKTCRISNALDTEDDNIYTDDMPELANDETDWDDKCETDSKEEEEE